MLKSPSSLQTPITKGKRPTQIIFLCHDQDRTSTFDDFNKLQLLQNHAPAKLIFSKNENCVVYCNLSFDEDSQSPKIIM